MQQQVPDDAKSLPNQGRSQAKTTCDSSYAPNSAQYYSLLQGTTPVQLCTTKYYSSTTLYYKVPLRTTKYQAVLLSTFPHYKTTPVLLCPTK